MKHRLLLLSFALLAITAGYSQKKDDAKEANDTGLAKDYNKWTLEFTAGQSKGTRPFTDGYYSSNPDQLFGSIRANSFSLGVRYMFSARFGLKADVSSDYLTNNKSTASKDFKLQQYRFGLQGVVNASRLFNIQQELGRLSILIHAGLQASRATPKLEEPGDPTSYYNKSELNLGAMFGISPELRISKKFSIIGDFSTLTNFRQHFTWDGHVSDQKNNLSGQMVMASLGITYSFGKDNIHGDWAVIDEGKLKQVEELDKRIGELETMMNDSDKDGVPDYLDVENNSISGVAVDTKGRMVDVNKNGVPDELEKYMTDNYVDKSNVRETIETANADMVKRLINEGYVTTYFDSNKTTPTNVSTEGIDFMLTFLRNNPSASINIIGHADEIGKSTYNDKLSIGRANTVKNTLIKAGINPDRLHVVSEGEDSSVAIDSGDARRLVRRVTFRVRE
ncbi:OmpA family protein [Flavobacterium sp. CYK-55]|uniref:OmpA family protein n=1 Tax=Flavobacterium sp. CYK-55 TaxID=2835529 RepID=UPI001BCA9393|nr:OmpA family protein [Flavobacterium sp. CYK-55]MBS7786872.1 OmpA family protein [Flavobacterium sp. CYK-55]